MTWWGKGRDTGAILDLGVAEALAEQMSLRATTPLEKGTALNYLGIIHHTRGEREHGLNRLTLAMDAFEAALTHWTRDLSLDHWAKAQMNLANSTHALAQRDRGNDRIGRAIEAALTVRTQDANPPQWAMTVLNRALSQADLATVRSDATLLDTVLSDMDSALAVWPAQTAGYYRATVLMHKGSALRNLSRLTGAPAPLEDSRICLAEAMDLFEQDSTPIDRLTAQGQDALTEIALAQSMADGADKAPFARARLTQICQDLIEAGHARGAQHLEHEAMTLAANDTAPDIAAFQRSNQRTATQTN